MKFYKPYIFLILGLLFFSCQDKTDTKKSAAEKSIKTEEVQQQKYAIVIHGGAGSMDENLMPDSLQQAYKEKLEEAVQAGYKILEDQGSAVKAVQTAINILEDSPLFNAGKGAVLNHREKPELDASIMEGKRLNAGAVAGISKVKNPIDLAIAVMEKSKHVMLSGEGAEKFAEEQGFEKVTEDYFITPNRLEAVRAAKSKEKTAYYDKNLNTDKLGTVGAVALDQKGNLAAGTSTGGLNNKRYGRIGDSPIIGAGNYANNKTCAVSGTGEGEFYIRGNVAYDLSALMEYKNLSVEEAAQKIIHEKQPELGGSGGLIAMDSYGNISMEFNTSGMFRAYKNQSGEMEVKIFKE